eukprot:4988220-Prymnesium_polylepis.1
MAQDSAPRRAAPCSPLAQANPGPVAHRPKIEDPWRSAADTSSEASRDAALYEPTRHARPAARQNDPGLLRRDRRWRRRNQVVIICTGERYCGSIESQACGNCGAAEAR